ncbi:hypothetical protein ANCCAN_15218 [Ancylostoma caninum]|uniref:Uncharacterized protein n=1 Tax=Ancylostoma caninum TaxID=29170 RepID=A0A368G345_ANCCA|nr:hypothetical protein ANCCAN_15218 [Ancylostoma caninum]
MLADKKKPGTGKGGMSTLAPKSKIHFEGFKGLEPLRDGDDVNLNSEECEDLKGKDALEQPAKDKGKPPPAGGTAPQATKPTASKETVTASKSKSDASGKKTLILGAMITIIILLALTSTATIVVTLHWYGSIHWFPALSAALQGKD